MLNKYVHYKPENIYTPCIPKPHYLTVLNPQQELRTHFQCCISKRDKISSRFAITIKYFPMSKYLNKL